jgi:hypothetical protein
LQQCPITLFHLQIKQGIVSKCSEYNKEQHFNLLGRGGGDQKGKDQTKKVHIKMPGDAQKNNSGETPTDIRLFQLSPQVW